MTVNSNLNYKAVRKENVFLFNRLIWTVYAAMTQSVSISTCCCNRWKLYTKTHTISQIIFIMVRTEDQTKYQYLFFYYYLIFTITQV